MKYLKSKQQLRDLLQTNSVIIVVFVDPAQFMPTKSLLNYLYSHRLNSHFNQNIFIWHIVDQEIYHTYQVYSFPKLVVQKANQILFSFTGYNREKANQSIQCLCRYLEKGKIVKKLNQKLAKCPQGHAMSILKDVDTVSTGYTGGCFTCDHCKRCGHIDQTKPILHCECCSYDVCWNCAYIDELLPIQTG